MNLYGISCNQAGFNNREKQLVIEMEAIRRGGKWPGGGLGLPAHFKNACRLLWPHIDWHRWTELANKEIRRPGAKVTTLLGPGSSGKTGSAAWQYLLEYYCRPHHTLVMVSSTDLRGLELRVWGEIKMLHELAKADFSWLPGFLIDSKHCITTDNLSDSDFDDERKVRDLRKGVIGIPCLQNGKFIGLKSWVGCKQKHLRLVADESQFMGSSFLNAFTNLNNNVDFQALVLGNPITETDPLGIAAEPLDGWANHQEPEKTEVWNTKFFRGRCVNFVGTDSPNFDQPETKYPYLISKEKIQDTIEFYGADSVQYYSQCKGVMKVGQLASRVLSRGLCDKFHAKDACDWDGPTKKICGLDAAYGGDRCVLGHAEFGRCVDGKVRLRMHPPTQVIIKVKTQGNLEAEEQIALTVMEYCLKHNIPPENFFHDSTGRGSLGTALARVWSADCNPVEFGGNPTKRPVRDDLFVWDTVAHAKRLKRADEHYSKFVTELWFTVRYCVEADQMRGMTDDVIDEFCLREWRMVKGDKIELETKDEMKERTRRSPDLADWCSIVTEGARRKSFLISKLGIQQNQSQGYDWLNKMRKEADTLRQKTQLVNS